MQFLPIIKQQTDAVVNITTGGGLGMTLEQRLAAALRASPEMCSLNMGSMNFGIYPMAAKYKEWKLEWEKPFLLASDDFIFRNTFKDIAHVIKELGEGHGTRFEYECYDVGHLYNLAHFVDRGLVKPPFLIQTIFGILGGIGADPDNVAFMRNTADKLFGRDSYQWSVLAAGRGERFARSGGARHKLDTPLAGIAVLQWVRDTVARSGLPCHVVLPGDDPDGRFQRRRSCTTAAPAKRLCQGCDHRRRRSAARGRKRGHSPHALRRRLQAPVSLVAEPAARGIFHPHQWFLI